MFGAVANRLDVIEVLFVNFPFAIPIVVDTLKEVTLCETFRMWLGQFDESAIGPRYIHEDPDWWKLSYKNPPKEALADGSGEGNMFRM